MKKELSFVTYFRPLIVGILISMLGEALIFIIWGVILYPEGSLLHKFIWTIVLCGFGMGSGGGALITLVVSGRFWGRLAILVCALISLVLLGLFCNFLCFEIDMSFNFFGAHETPDLFIWNGIIMSVVGGVLIGWLCFTHKGNALLERVNL